MIYASESLDLNLKNVKFIDWSVKKNDQRYGGSWKNMVQVYRLVGNVRRKLSLLIILSIVYMVQKDIVVKVGDGCGGMVKKASSNSINSFGQPPT